MAPLVAADHPQTAFVVILAGMGQSGRDILLYQSSSMFRKGGQAEDWITESTRIRAAIFDAVGAGEPVEVVRRRPRPTGSSTSVRCFFRRHHIFFFCFRL